ncbi:MAG TPA: MEDS domain-containing protein [Pseudonocardia sp.]|nr:MEDS domain-containing protein [Pseudonocardia sp.]
MAEEEVASAYAAAPEDGHQLLVTEEDGEEDLARWAERGLARGDKLLVAADERHPDGAALVETLTRHGLAAAGAARDGRIEVVAAARFYNAEGYEQLVEQSLRDGHGGVRSFGGPHIAAGVLDPAGFAEFERLLGRLWASRGASALCCYPGVRDETLDEAIRRHRSGWRHRLLHLHDRGHGRLDVHGEIDSSNDELFAALLAAATHRVSTGTDTEPLPGKRRVHEPESDPSGTEVHGRRRLLVLDCTGLTFSSVSGWRATVAGTEAFRAGGGRVALTGLHPLAVRLLHMTGFAAAFDLPETGGGNRR